MLFPSRDYLVFLPLTVLVFWSVPAAWRVAVLLVASIFFYASWNPADLPVLFGVAALGWALGRVFGRAGARPGRASGVLSVGLLLLPLLVFKYWDWLATDASTALSWAGLDVRLPTFDLALPIGLSFFTFQALSYVLDVRKDGKAEPSPVRFGAYLAFFPHLVAGPIVRRDELIPQLRRLTGLREGDVGVGLYRIGRGMAKKVLFADVLRVSMVDPLFDDPTRFIGPELLIGLYAYSLQIYCDFSGYTDIALGSARLFGVELPENFRRPYRATSVAGFWRRWHVTLSNWVRDYVYFPMGGAHGTTAQVTGRIVLTMVIIGVWHGASWTFVVYGLLHGAAVALNRVQRKRTGRRPDDPLPSAWAFAWRFLLTFHFVVLARVLFRAPDLASAWAYLDAMGHWTWLMPRFAPTAWAVLLAGYALHFSPERWRDDAQRWFLAARPVGWAAVLALLAASCLTFGTGESLAFVYYDF
jgi:D-alanyl-lipoteichoic acid acyltransferase DltB (MBOAT superfamily)